MDMSAKLWSAAVLAGLVLVHAAPAVSRSTSERGVWKEWRDREAYKNPPPIFIKIRRGELYSSSGRRVSSSEVVNDLKALVPSAGHPVPVFILDRSSINAYPKLKVAIERTGICRDSACFFKRPSFNSGN